MKSSLLATVAAITILVATPAHAWGPEGHALVADIAEMHLTPRAQTAVTQLLASEGLQHLNEVSSWADGVRDHERKTAFWHFVNVPLNAPVYVAARDCPRGDCITVKVADMARVLANPNQPIQVREEALKWVVHFIADLHQPLHVSDNNDRGGGEVRVTFFGRPATLHEVWDHYLIDQATGLHVGYDYAVDQRSTWQAAVNMNRPLTPQVVANFASGIDQQNLGAAIEQWTNETHQLAPRAYQFSPTGIGQAYENTNWPVVVGQLQKAGLRLAAVLNASF